MIDIQNRCRTSKTLLRWGCILNPKPSPESSWYCRRSTISDRCVLRTGILHYLTLIVLTVSQSTPNLVVSSADCVISTAETVSHQIPVIRIFIRIAHHWWTTSDIFPCFLRLIIFLNLQVQRFVGRRRPFGTPLPTRRCRASSPSSCIRIPLKNTFTIASLVFARIVSRMDDRFSIFLIQNIQVMLGCGFTWLFLVEILRLGCHYSNYSQI